MIFVQVWSMVEWFRIISVDWPLKSIAYEIYKIHALIVLIVQLLVSS